MMLLHRIANRRRLASFLLGGSVGGGDFRGMLRLGHSVWQR